jgi:dienelactone hydrolase
VAEIVLFHHAQGQTPGFLDFADELTRVGHTVHAPDLYSGITFAEFADGVAYAEHLGFDSIVERGAAAVEELPQGLVYAGFSLGVLPAQMLTQTRKGAMGAVLMHSCVPTSEFDAPWPDGVRLQIHGMEDDEWFELDVAQQLAAQIETAELFLYPGAGHLFADNGLRDFDAEATSLVTGRVLQFLDEMG